MHFVCFEMFFFVIAFVARVMWSLDKIGFIQTAFSCEEQFR